jgi:CheY-like chemotaxis protein
LTTALSSSKTLSLKLHRWGYGVVTARDCSSALKTVRSAKPDLILLDINLESKVTSAGQTPCDGLHLMGRFRRMPSVRQTPVLIMTSEDPAEFKPRALSGGAAGFFSKPINNERLLAAVREILGEGMPQTV